MMRYRYHFTTYNGWMNDPNGLIFHNGEYHMYFQYNPDSVEWGNICWGHAVSNDLMNWHMEGVVLRPDEHGMIYSGSAIADGDTIYYFYTAALKGHFTQRLAVSHDGGYTLQKDPDFEVGTICPENRDPKVIYHKDSNAYIMCLWLEGNDFAILRSVKADGKYKMTQRFTLPGGFECPNLFECGDSWFVWTADGYYYPGTFDGYEFHWNGIRHAAYRDKIPYAAQIFSGTDRCIMIPWLKTPTVDDRWTGMMGIPRMLEAVADKTENRNEPQTDRKDRLLKMIPMVNGISHIQTDSESSDDVIRDLNVTEITDTDKTRLSVKWESSCN